MDLDYTNMMTNMAKRHQAAENTHWARRYGMYQTDVDDKKLFVDNSHRVPMSSLSLLSHYVFITSSHQQLRQSLTASQQLQWNNDRSYLPSNPQQVMIKWLQNNTHVIHYY